MEKFLKGYGIFAVVLIIVATIVTFVVGGVLVGAMSADTNPPNIESGEDAMGVIAGEFAKGLGKAILLGMGIILLVVGAIELLFMVFFIKNYIDATKHGKITKTMDTVSVIAFAIVFILGIVASATNKDAVWLGIVIMLYAVIMEGYAIPSLKFMKKRQNEVLYGAENEVQ